MPGSCTYGEPLGSLWRCYYRSESTDDVNANNNFVSVENALISSGTETRQRLL